MPTVVSMISKKGSLNTASQGSGNKTDSKLVVTRLSIRGDRVNTGAGCYSIRVVHMVHWTDGASATGIAMYRTVDGQTST